MASEPFNPDWTLAPAAFLQEIMAKREATVAKLAALATTAAPAWPASVAVQLIEDTLSRRPLNAQHAAVLSAATGTTVRFWLGAEAQYRADLAAGRKDTTPEATDA